MSVGRNTIMSEELLGYITRIEAIESEKKELVADKKAVVAEAVASGFSAAGIAYCVKVRAMKPHDWQEAESVRETYLHAIGLGDAPPLFRLMGMIDVDKTSRDSVLSAIEQIVPTTGDVILRIGGEPVRLWRDKDGTVRREPWSEARPAEPAAKPAKTGKTTAPPVLPEVDEAGASALGRQYFRDNRSVIDNPFPFGDPRRARFDEGWRAESGSDGMGPDEGGGS